MCHQLGSITIDEETERVVAMIDRDADTLLVLGDDYLARQSTEHPSFAGHTVNYLDMHPGGISSYSREHIINSVMYEVGLEPIERSALPAGEAFVDVSAERLADYDADVLLVYPFDRTEDQLRDEVPTLAALDSVRNDRLFVLEDLALSNSSVLSIPYALDTLLPGIERALDPGS